MDLKKKYEELKAEVLEVQSDIVKNTEYLNHRRLRGVELNAQLELLGSLIEEEKRDESNCDKPKDK